MFLKTKVMVANVTNLSDARYCAGMGVDLLGFPIGKGTGQISSEVFANISEWVAGPEFVFECPHDINDEELVKVTQLPSVSHIRVNSEQLRRHQPLLKNCSLLLNISLSEWPKLRDELPEISVKYILITDDRSVDWNVVQAINEEIPVLMDYSLVASVDDLNTLPITGIALSGTSEDKPGLKDYDHLSSVLELLTLE